MDDHNENKAEDAPEASSEPQTESEEPVRKKRPTLLGAILGLTLLVLGVLSSYGTVNSWNQAQGMKSWKQAPGVVMASETVEINGREHLKFEYEFKLEGKTYKNIRPTLYSPMKMEDVLKNFPPGKKVTVFYNPEDPRNASLNNTPPTFLAFMALMAIFGLFGLFGFAILYFSMRTPKI